MKLSCVHILGWLKSLLTLLVLPVQSMATGGLWPPIRSACARCRRQTTPMEQLVLQIYPGLFSPTPPSHSVAGQDTSAYNFVYSASAEIHRPFSGNSPRDTTRHHTNSSISSKHVQHNEGVSGSGRGGKNNTHKLLSNNKPLWESTKEPKLKDYGTTHKAPPSCCQTVLEYVTPPNVTIKGRVYRVVHLRNAFQFIPVAKCKPGTTCVYGECVERYRAHWVLIYNRTQPHTAPPVNFTPLEVPSHCECLNVGKP